MTTISAGGRGIEVIRHGPGPDVAPTLVFLHDGIGCAATWRDFPEALARETGCGALVYSRAGYGGSITGRLVMTPSTSHGIGSGTDTGDTGSGNTEATGWGRAGTTFGEEAVEERTEEELGSEEETGGGLA